MLDHGTGARLSRELVELIVEELGEVYSGEMEDSAILPRPSGPLAMTTDSFVVDPPVFGNGDIGKIAVCGTVNDLAVIGAEPMYLTLGMILETELPMALLRRVLRSIQEVALEAGVLIVAGDTKVVRVSEVGGLYLNTSGVGVFTRSPLRMSTVRPGDRIILSGSIGNHTVHLLSIREGLGFENNVLSDCAPLNKMISSLVDSAAGKHVRSMRDVTRGGFSAVMHEYASALNLTMHVDESALPIDREVRMAADMLGINPIHAANEGCLCLFVAPDAADAVLERLHAHPYGRRAVVVGEVRERARWALEMTGLDGRTGSVQELRGAELPRLC